MILTFDLSLLGEGECEIIFDFFVDIYSWIQSNYRFRRNNSIFNIQDLSGDSWENYTIKWWNLKNNGERGRHAIVADMRVEQEEEEEQQQNMINMREEKFINKPHNTIWDLVNLKKNISW